jgi:DNA ligase-1
MKPIKPMLASAVEDTASLDYPLLGTPKIDGIRCMVVDGRALTRSLKPLPNLAVREYLESTCPSGFDGELIVPGGTFQDSTSAFMTRDGTPDFEFCVFDWLRDPSEPYASRVERLRDYFEHHNSSWVVPVLPKIISSEDELFAYEEECLAKGYEGVMLRHPNGPYKFGRATAQSQWLLKLKRFEDGEARVVSYYELMHNANEAKRNMLGYIERSSHKANMVGKQILGGLVVQDVVSGIEFSIGTGFDAALRERLWEDRDSLAGRIVKYKYQPTGVKEKPRFPVFIGFRDGRDL